MADGREEREEQVSRIETENAKPNNREDLFDRDYVDDWIPERVDS